MSATYISFMGRKDTSTFAVRTWPYTAPALGVLLDQTLKTCGWAHEVGMTQGT